MPDPETPDADGPNLSVDHQKDGDARQPSDTLDKGQPHTKDEDDPARKSSLT